MRFNSITTSISGWLIHPCMNPSASLGSLWRGFFTFYNTYHAKDMSRGFQSRIQDIPSIVSSIRQTAAIELTHSNNATAYTPSAKPM